MPITKGQILYESTYGTLNRQIQRQKVEGWLPGDEGERNEVLLFNCYRPLV
jgi:hypothetical protein